MSKYNNIIFNENGATAIEYSLIAALISVGIISSTRTVGTRIQEVFSNVGDNMSGATSPAASNGSRS